MLRTALIYVTIILLAGVLFLAARWTNRLSRRGRWLALAAALAIYAVLILTMTSAWTLSNLAVLAVSILVASLIGGMLSSTPALIAFCVAAGLVDFFSFSGGLTAKIIADYRSGQSLLQHYLSISVPLNGELTPLIGIGDLIILGSIYAALRGLGYADWTAFVAPLAGLLLALALGLALGGIYALPFISATTIVYLIWQRRARPGETQLN